MSLSRDPPPHFFNTSTAAQDDGPFPDAGGDVDEENIYRNMPITEVLEDLSARFLVNLPKEERTLVRMYWQAEQAHWFYEDYLRPLNPSLPAMGQRQFTHLIIASSPLQSALASSTTGDGEEIDYDETWLEYCSYKKMVPVCGGILINRQGDKVLMVRGWKSTAGWSFPRGKINSEESEESCAIREVEEETGFDLTGLIDPNDKIHTHVNAQSVTMFIVHGIDESTTFETQTRNEIGAIEWIKLTDLPTWTKKGNQSRNKGKRFFNVTPFVGPIKKSLRAHGFDSSNKTAKAKPPAPRDLQPYDFAPTAALPNPATRPKHQPTVTLDDLFAKFVHKQEEDLSTGGLTVATDNKAGLERLFGGLAVNDPSSGSVQVQPIVPSANSREMRDAETLKQEDDALARLLGAIGTSSTPAPGPSSPSPAPTPAKAKLLAVLNQKPIPSAAPPDIRTHQASLLYMLSPPPPPASASSSSSASTAHPVKPISLPTSPRPADDETAATEAERRNKQRALLEMTVAGMGLDSILPPPPPHQGGNPSVGPRQLYPAQSIGNKPPPGSNYVSAPHAHALGSTIVHSPQGSTVQAGPYRPIPVPSVPYPNIAGGIQQNPNYAQAHQPQPALFMQGNPPAQTSPGRRQAPPSYDSHFPPPPHQMPSFARPPQPLTQPGSLDNSVNQGVYRPPPPIVQPNFSHNHTNQNYRPAPPPFPPAVGMPQQYSNNPQQYPPFPQNQGGFLPFPPPPPNVNPNPVYTQQFRPPPIAPVPSHGQYQAQAPIQNMFQGAYPSSGVPSGPVHQPIPRSGVQGGLLAMLNEGRGR